MELGNLSKEELIEQVESAQERLDLLEDKLPWYRKFHRRYMTGRMFWSWNLSSVLTYCSSFTMAVGVFGIQAMKTATVLKLTALVSWLSSAFLKIWSGIKFGVTFVIGVIFHS